MSLIKNIRFDNKAEGLSRLTCWCIANTGTFEELEARVSDLVNYQLLPLLP